MTVYIFTFYIVIFCTTTVALKLMDHVTTSMKAVYMFHVFDYNTLNLLHTFLMIEIMFHDTGTDDKRSWFVCQSKMSSDIKKPSARIISQTHLLYPDYI